MTPRVPSPARLAYDDPAPLDELSDDARQCERRLQEIARRVAGPVPSIRYDDQPREVAKVDITVSAAAQRLANALPLHLD